MTVMHLDLADPYQETYLDVGEAQVVGGAKVENGDRCLTRYLALKGDAHAGQQAFGNAAHIMAQKEIPRPSVASTI